MGVPLVLEPIAVLGIAGLVAYVLGRRLRVVSGLVALAASVWAFVDVIRIFADLPGRYRWLWFEGARFSVSVDVLPTRFNSVIGLFIGLFVLLVVLYSLHHVRKTRDIGRYWAFVLWAGSASIAAAFANNLLFFLVAWEVVTVMLFLLVNLGREKAAAGAAKSFALLGFSDCAILLGIALVLASGIPTLSMDKLHLPTNPLGYVIFILFVIGAVTKAGAMPFHTWIPKASEGAPMPVMALLPASLDKLLGIYFLARIALDFFTPDPFMRHLLMIIGAATIICAVMMAMVQHNLRKLLSYHAVSQVGYMVLGIGTGNIIGIIGGLFHMVNHAIYKSCLFLCAGNVEERARTTELDQLGGLARYMPTTFVCCLVAALSISGVPPFNGFASKWLVYRGVMATGGGAAIIYLVAAVFGSALTLASFVKVLYSTFLGRKPETLDVAPARSSWLLANLPVVVLAILCVLFGVWWTLPVGTLLWPALEGVAAGETLTEVLATGGVWGAGTATVLILLGVLIGLVGCLLLGGRRLRVAPPFLGGERLPGDLERLPGTDFYRTVSEMPFFRTVFKDAEGGAYDVYYLGGKYGLALVELLRRCHTGVLTLYVSWFMFGLAAVIGYLIRV